MGRKSSGLSGVQVLGSITVPLRLFFNEGEQLKELQRCTKLVRAPGQPHPLPTQASNLLAPHRVAVRTINPDHG